ARGRDSWRRGYSDRAPPPPPPAAAEGGGGEGGAFVSGDSHIRAVRDVNYELRRGNGGGVPRRPYRPRPPPYRPPPPWSGPPPPPPYGAPPPGHGPTARYYGPPMGLGPPPPHPPPGFGPPPLPYGSFPPGYGAFPPSISHPPPLYGPPQVGRPQMPQPRLADYRREWRFAPLQPPPQSERFVVLSYNILADYLARDHQSKLYFHIPGFILDWEWRKKRILFEFGLWAPDIICLQEVDKFHDLQEELAIRGYNGLWKMRTGNAVDGCAVFWRTNRYTNLEHCDIVTGQHLKHDFWFQLRYEGQIEFSELGLRDNVAQICVLESVNKGLVGSKSESILESSDQSRQANHLVICNIHVLYNPKRGEIKLGQVRTLFERAYTVSKMWNDAPVIICGDFNCTPKSPLYNFISEQKLYPQDIIEKTSSNLAVEKEKEFSDLSVGDENKTKIEDPSSSGCHGTFSLLDDLKTVQDNAVLNDPKQLDYDETCEPSGSNNISGSDENSDPNFFKELLGSEEDTLHDSSFVEIQGDTLHDTCPSGADRERHIYNPYFWTPMEIKAASGNEECTSIKHRLKLRSTYTDVEDYAGTKDSSREPQVTSYNTQFMGTVDYI
ncbi:Carbon catabolite repressor protein 6, partial [Ananas comosus]